MKHTPEDCVYWKKKTDNEASKRYSVYREQRPPGDENHGWYAVTCV